MFKGIGELPRESVFKGTKCQEKGRWMNVLQQPLSLGLLPVLGVGHIYFWLLAPSTLREYIYIVLSHLVLGHLLQQPQGTHTCYKYEVIYIPPVLLAGILVLSWIEGSSSLNTPQRPQECFFCGSENEFFSLLICCFLLPSTRSEWCRSPAWCVCRRKWAF